MRRYSRPTAESASFVCCPQGCPCGYLTDPRKECHCTPRQVQAYMGKISGPLLDRIDIQVEVPAVHYRDLPPPRCLLRRRRKRGLWRASLRSPAEGEPSATIRERVIRARERQSARFSGDGVFCPSTLLRVNDNARMGNRLIRKFCKAVPCRSLDTNVRA